MNFLDLLRSQDSFPLSSLARILDSDDPQVASFPSESAPRGIASTSSDNLSSVLTDFPPDLSIDTFRCFGPHSFALRSGDLSLYSNGASELIFSRVAEAKWSNYALLVLLQNGELVIYDPALKREAGARFPSGADFSQTHLAPGKAEPLWAAYGAIVASENGSLGFVQPCLPRGYAMPAAERERLGLDVDEYDYLFAAAGCLGGLLGRGISGTRHMLDVRIQGKIEAVEWVDSEICVLAREEMVWKLETVRMERVPTFLDEEGLVPAQVIRSVTFGSPVWLVGNIWGVFVVGEARAELAAEAVGWDGAYRPWVTEAAVENRIAKLAQRGEELRQRESRLREQILDILGQIEAVKGVDERRLLELLRKAGTLARGVGIRNRANSGGRRRSPE
jgi:hypothetical protein